MKNTFKLEQQKLNDVKCVHRKFVATPSPQSQRKKVLVSNSRKNSSQVKTNTKHKWRESVFGSINYRLDELNRNHSVEGFLLIKCKQYDTFSLFENVADLICTD